MYKRGETVWVVHNRFKPLDEMKLVQVKVYSGEERYGYGLNSRSRIYYKLDKEKYSVDTDFVEYTKNSLVNKLSEQTKKRI